MDNSYDEALGGVPWALASGLPGRPCTARQPPASRMATIASVNLYEQRAPAPVRPAFAVGHSAPSAAAVSDGLKCFGSATLTGAELTNISTVDKASMAPQ